MRFGGVDDSAHTAHIRAKLQVIYDQVAETEPIKAGQARLAAAREKVARVRRAQGRLNSRLAELRSELQSAQDSVTATIVGRFADAAVSQAELVKLAKPLDAVLTEERLLLGAIDRIALSDTWTFQAAAQIAEANLNETFAAELDQEAAARLKQTHELAQAVLEHEGTVTLPGGGATISGALQSAARGLREHAHGCRGAAAELLAKQATLTDNLALSTHRWSQR